MSESDDIKPMRVGVARPIADMRALPIVLYYNRGSSSSARGQRWRPWAMNSEYPSSSRGSGRTNLVNKQGVIAVALSLVYTAMEGWTRVFFSVFVQLVAFEPLLPTVAFVLGVIATAVRREFLGWLATCALASVYTTVVFILLNVEWQIVKWAEWTLIRAWVATLLFLAGSLIVIAVKTVNSMVRNRESS